MDQRHHPGQAGVGIEQSRDNGMHALRHWYASVLLDAGESIRAVSEYLGHSDPGFTLRTYTHLMPSSTERTRAAIDTAFAAGRCAGNDRGNDEKEILRRIASRS
jgi:integrase